MSLALIIAFLTGHQFNTVCTQTQDSGKSGYAIDSLSFEKGSSREDDKLAVKFVRTFYADTECKGEEESSKTQIGSVKVLGAIEGFFKNNTGEEQFGANWSLNVAKEEQIEEGSIGVNTRKSQLRISRNTPGFGRNTMLNMIAYDATAK